MTKIDRALRDEIRDYFDSNPNISFDHVAHVYGMSYGIKRQDIKTILMSED